MLQRKSTIYEKTMGKLRNKTNVKLADNEHHNQAIF